jgi:hypothetical protein
MEVGRFLSQKFDFTSLIAAGRIVPNWSFMNQRERKTPEVAHYGCLCV